MWNASDACRGQGQLEVRPYLAPPLVQIIVDFVNGGYPVTKACVWSFDCIEDGGPRSPNNGDETVSLFGD